MGLVFLLSCFCEKKQRFDNINILSRGRATNTSSSPSHICGYATWWGRVRGENTAMHTEVVLKECGPCGSDVLLCKEDMRASQCWGLSKQLRVTDPKQPDIPRDSSAGMVAASPARGAAVGPRKSHKSPLHSHGRRGALTKHGCT